MNVRKVQDCESGKDGLIKLVYTFFNVKLKRFLNLPPKEIPFIIMYLSKRCNSRCKMCDQWKTDEKTIEKEISTRNWLRIIDSITKLKPIMIVFTGGEPLARPDIFKIIAHLQKKDIRYHLCTNGTLINKSTLSMLKTYPPSSISVSLDGDNAKIHDELRGLDCFNTVLDGIRLLKRELPTTRVGINFLLCKKNFKNMTRMVTFAKGLGADRLNLQPIHTNLLHKDKALESFDGLLFLEQDISELRMELRKFRNVAARLGLKTNSARFLDKIPRLYDSSRKNNRDCHAGYVSIVIDPFGRVAPCANMDGMPCIHRDKVRDFRALMASPGYALLRKKVRICQASCWDTFNGELRLRFSIANIPLSSMNWLKDRKYYLGTAKRSGKGSQ